MGCGEVKGRSLKQLPWQWVTGNTACLELGFINYVGFISLTSTWLHIILGPSNAFVLFDFGPLIGDMDGCMGHNKFFKIKNEISLEWGWQWVGLSG